MIPREPTDEMVAAAKRAISGYALEHTLIAVWKAMWDAASGMEARRAAAENTDAVHDSPVPLGRRPNPIGDIPQDV